MSRTLKFRGWDKEAQQMLYQADSGDMMKSAGNFLSGFRYCIPMQFTGLSDKNGVEIYEGDILHLVSPEGTDSQFKIDEKGVVEWSPKGFYHINYGDGFRNIEVRASKDLVVGNIHEHPELLGDNRHKR